MNMLVLGWHGSVALRETDYAERGYYAHDGAAALIKDGSIVAAIEEERLNRIKHSNFFPFRAIRFCLREVGASITDLDAIVTDNVESTYEIFADDRALRNPGEPVQSARGMINQVFEREFGLSVIDKIRFCRHHHAHLLSAWYSSKFSDALVVSLDGDGDYASGLIAHCKHDKIKILRYLPREESLGNFYTWAIGFLGYRRFDEYKVMGLAPYGNPATYKSIFCSMFETLPEGRYKFVSFEELMDIARKGGLSELRRSKDKEFTQAHKDFAAGLQKTLELLATHVITHFQKVTGTQRLCLTGGVAQNCSMNAEILKSGTFEDVYVQPVSYDAGNALGAALSFLQEGGHKIRIPVLPHLYWGSETGTTEVVGKRLIAWSKLISFNRSSNIAAQAAQLIADGNVIGWMQGRSEFGARALGNRSILADPRPAENKHIINEMIKKREGYRPFAPSVIEERLHDFFEAPPTLKSAPFMVITLPVKEEYRQLLGAVTHVDGSARVQTVSQKVNPLFYAVIEEFSKLTGVPIVLNTSFNNNFEPIVDSVDDAVTCFMTTGLDRLIISDLIVEKQATFEKGMLLHFEIKLPPTRRLVLRTQASGIHQYLIECNADEVFVGAAVEISKSLFFALFDSEGKAMMSRLEEVGLDRGYELDDLAVEIFSLWERRAILLSPLGKLREAMSDAEFSQASSDTV
jgi:carbamoyltransferase